MIKLGFASAILPDQEFTSVMQLASQIGYECVEVMCWPISKAERRYSGITHIDISTLTEAKIAEVNCICEETGVEISALGYYPNCLSPDVSEANAAVDHLKKLISAAPKLGIFNVNTFVGRDYTQSVDANWPRFLETWKPIIALAESLNVKIGIENCPMLFTADEWPGGKNLAISPAIWRRMFEAIPSPNFGLNYDPSHMIWQRMDYLKPLRDFSDRIFHVHAKDVRVDQHLLDEHGILAHPLKYHTPKLPGLGEVNWGQFFSVLADTQYDGSVCVEVEDRAYEGSLTNRQESLRQSFRYLSQFTPVIPK